MTDHVALGEAARYICTPNHGTRFDAEDDFKNDDKRFLEELQDKCDYVAVGNGRFKKIG